jgi:hypothetical protein
MKGLNMKFIAAILITVILLGVFPVTVLASSQSAVVIGNSYTLESGKTLNDDLFILGGSVNLESGSTINGNVILLGGNVQAAGTINGSFTVLGGTLNLAGTFILNGNLTSAGTVINRDPNAQIRGQINNNNNTPSLILPGGTRIPRLNSNIDPFFKVVGFFLGLFLWAFGAMLAAMFIAPQLMRISQTTLSQPLISGGLGLLTVIIVPIILVLLAITICLIPIALIGVFLLLLAWIFGMIAMGLEVGKRISVAFKQQWHPAVAAGLGTLLLMTVLNVLQTTIPCVGWIPKALVGFLGLGAVLLTQFGTKPYNPNIMSMPQVGSGGAATS